MKGAMIARFIGSLVGVGKAAPLIAWGPSGVQQQRTRVHNMALALVALGLLYLFSKTASLPNPLSDAIMATIGFTCAWVVRRTAEYFDAFRRFYLDLDPQTLRLPTSKLWAVWWTCRWALTGYGLHCVQTLVMLLVTPPFPKLRRDRDGLALHLEKRMEMFWNAWEDWRFRVCVVAMQVVAYAMVLASVAVVIDSSTGALGYILMVIGLFIILMAMRNGAVLRRQKLGIKK